MDFAETFSRGCAQTLLRFFGFIAALWIGGWIAGLSLGMGHVVMDPILGWRHVLNSLILGPAVLLSKWFFLNLIVVIGGLGWFVRTERDLAKFWGALVAMFGFLGVAGRSSTYEFHIWPLVAVWLSYLVVTASMLSAVVYVVVWRRNRWAGEMAMLQAENAQRRAELENCGIATFGREPED